MKVHILGIGGVGMSALAWLYWEQGWKVQGSDLRPSPITQYLEQRGVSISFQPVSLEDIDLWIYPNGISKNHPEYLEALQKGILIQSKKEALENFCLSLQTKGISVIGVQSHPLSAALLAEFFPNSGCYAGILRRDQRPHARLGSPFFVEISKNWRNPSIFQWIFPRKDLFIPFEKKGQKGLYTLWHTPYGDLLLPVGRVWKEAATIALQAVLTFQQEPGDMLSQLPLFDRLWTGYLHPIGTKLKFHDVRTYPQTMAQSLDDLKEAGFLQIQVLMRPYPPVFDLFSPHDYAKALSSAAKVWLLPDYFDSKAPRAKTLLKILPTAQWFLDDLKYSGICVGFGGDDIEDLLKSL